VSRSGPYGGASNLGLQVEEAVVAKTIRRGAFAASTMVILLAACGGSTGKTNTAIATGTLTPPVATPTEDAALATRVAGSPAAKLGPTLLSPADFPPDLIVQGQQAQIVAAGYVPGLASEASAFFATVATDSGDEFVNLIAIAVDSNAGASAALDAFTSDNYLPGLTGGAADAATGLLDVSSAPPGSKGFGFSGTLPASVPGGTGQGIMGQALGFVRGSTFVLLVHGLFVPSARGIDVSTIAAAIDARLAAVTGP
jgi:hypothetical protein